MRRNFVSSLIKVGVPNKNSDPTDQAGPTTYRYFLEVLSKRLHLLR